MTLKKIFIIGAAAAALVTCAVTAYLITEKYYNKINPNDILLQDYQNLLDELEKPAVRENLVSSCGDKQQFGQKIKNLEDKLNYLRQRKLNLYDIKGEEYIPEAGGQPLDLVEPTDIEKINSIEAKIILAINSLKSLCDNQGIEKVVSNSCQDACQRYSDCAGYTEGATQEDQQDAYESCLEECQKWSAETRRCINRQEIKTVDDCTNMSICALKEYGDAFN